MENQHKFPANPYGETKLIIENMLKYLDLTNQIKFVSLRYFNACGADFKSKIGEWHTPETHLIPLILDVALGKKEFISIFGDDYNTKDGTCIRDYIHVCDLAQAHILALDYLQNKGESEIFNLGSEEGYSVKEIIESAKRVCQKDIPIKIEKRRSGDPAILIADSSKAKELLNWERKYKNIDEIIKSAWMWHKINL